MPPRPTRLRATHPSERRSGPAAAFGPTRQALIAEARAHLLTHGWPRLQTALIGAGAGGGAFLASVGLLAAGLDAMGWRYALAALAGYLTFLVLVRVWIAWHRGGADLADVDAGWPEALGDNVGAGTARGGSALFRGGGSGGGGGGASFGDVPMPSAPVRAAMPLVDGGPTASLSSTSDGGSSDGGGWLEGLFDGDDGVLVVVAGACIAATLVAVVYVIYAAPLLLAEVAVDAAVIAPLYRRLRREDTRHWSRGLVRGTWVAELLVVCSAASAGYVLQRIAPEARSVGGVVAALTSPDASTGR